MRHKSDCCGTWAIILFAYTPIQYVCNSCGKKGVVKNDGIEVLNSKKKVDKDGNKIA